MVDAEEEGVVLHQAPFLRNEMYMFHDYLQRDAYINATREREAWDKKQLIEH